MKILMIGAKQFPSRQGGVDIVVQRLAEEMGKLGHSVTVLTHKSKNRTGQKSFQNIEVKEVFTIEKKATSAILYSYFATKYAKKHRFDIIHFHAEGNTLFINKLKKSKNVVVTIHGLDWKRSKFSGIGSKILKKSEKKIAKYANAITTLVENDNSYFERIYQRTTTIIPNGVDAPTKLKPNVILNKYGLTTGSYILFLARIVPEKGLHYLLDAYASLNNTQYKLVIAGGASHSSEYYQDVLNRTKGNKNILTTGFVSGNELYELFSNAFLYVLPSDIEGMPLSLIEALSYKNICLCSDIKELKDIHSKNITYFTSGDVDDLKQKMESLLQAKPVFQDEDIFDEWSTIAKKYLDVYKEVLE